MTAGQKEDSEYKGFLSLLPGLTDVSFSALAQHPTMNHSRNNEPSKPTLPLSQVVFHSDGKSGMLSKV